MAASAIRAEFTLVGVVFGVAGLTVFGRALEDFIDMALFACNAHMSAGELEGGFGVVEGGFFPIVRGVAAAAYFAKTTLVSVVLGVAIRAACGRSL